jgi:DNA-binding HxlR family transcriptional regulator
MTASNKSNANLGRVTPGSLSRTLNVIGDPWSLNILRAAFQGVHRFQDFQDQLKIPKQTLMLRLARLTDNAVFYKKPVKHTRVVYEYHLTPKGLDLYAFISMIWRWHRRWHKGEPILPAKLYHRSCGNILEPVLRCGACHESPESGNVEYQHVTDSSVDLDKSSRRPRILNELEKRGDDFLASVVIGDCWSILVLNAVLRGVQNYDALQKSLSISSNVLSSRLKTLLSLNLLQQQQSTHDRRMYSYTATEKAHDIYPIILSLIHWGDRWLAGSEGPPDLLRHTACGQLLTPELCCKACGEKLRAGLVTTRKPTIE